MKQFFIALLTVLLFSVVSVAQKNNTGNHHKVALFAPLYLDSVFNGNNYNYGKKFPRFALQGIDFIQGAQIALDSFPAKGQNWDFYIYDTKSDSMPVSAIIEKHLLDSVQLIIGWVKEDDLDQLADFAKHHSVPFVSASHPNDQGITDNPYFIMIDSTLKTHCESIFSNLLQNHGTDRIILARPTGAQENKVEGYFNSSNNQDGKNLLKIQTVIIDSNFSKIINGLDSNKNNVIIGGSLDEEFAKNLTAALYNIPKKYKITLFGMPNWSGFSTFGKSARATGKNYPFFFTSNYYNEKTDSVSDVIKNAYSLKYKGVPSDFAYKGFEIVYYFTRILSEKNSQLTTDLNNQDYLVFSKYNFMPVNLSKKKKDYFENKHLYFLKRVNGKTSSSSE